MKFQKRILASLLLASTVFFASCEENSLIDPPSGTPMAPTNIMVSTRSANSIAVKWSRPAADTVTVTGFDVIATPSGGTPITATSNLGTDTMLIVSGLTEGTVYTFTVRAKAGSNMSPASSGVMWAPAKRTTSSGKIYVSASSLGSGLNLASGANLTIANGGQWDICLDDKDGNILVGSPGVSGYVNSSFQFPNGQDAKIVRIGTKVYTANSLNEIWENTSFGTAQGDNNPQYAENLINLSSSQYSPANGGVGFIAAVFTGPNNTTPVNFAKVLIKTNTAKTSFVQGSGNDRYVEVEVSYQSSQNTPYAISKIVDFGGARTTSNTIQNANN